MTRNKTQEKERHTSNRRRMMADQNLEVYLFEGKEEEEGTVTKGQWKGWVGGYLQACVFFRFRQESVRVCSFHRRCLVRIRQDMCLNSSFSCDQGAVLHRNAQYVRSSAVMPGLYLCYVASICIKLGE